MAGNRAKRDGDQRRLEPSIPWGSLDQWLAETQSLGAESTVPGITPASSSYRPPRNRHYPLRQLHWPWASAYHISSCRVFMLGHENRNFFRVLMTRILRPLHLHGDQLTINLHDVVDLKTIVCPQIVKRSFSKTYQTPPQLHPHPLLEKRTGGREDAVGGWRETGGGISNSRVKEDEPGRFHQSPPSASMIRQNGKSNEHVLEKLIMRPALWKSFADSGELTGVLSSPSYPWTA